MNIYTSAKIMATIAKTGGPKDRIRLIRRKRRALMMMMMVVVFITEQSNASQCRSDIVVDVMVGRLRINIFKPMIFNIHHVVAHHYMGVHDLLWLTFFLLS